MKAVILISSIFYLLGLRIGHNPELFRKNLSQGNVHSNKMSKPANTGKNYYWKTETRNTKKADPDSLGCKNAVGKSVPGVSE